MVVLVMLNNEIKLIINVDLLRFFIKILVLFLILVIFNNFLVIRYF